MSKEFVREGGATVRAIDKATLFVNEKEIVVLLGPSGCGKSTLLRSIAGLEAPNSGLIRIGGETVFDSARNIDIPPYDRDINMMFQSYALWPHMTLEANVAYPLRVRGISKRTAQAEANDYLELVGLGGLGRQYAGSVSGGQAQRAALARTLIAKPAVVLFDEPLSNVDAKVRSRLRRELLRIHAELGFSALYVTHDQIEAMGVGSRIAVMRAGRILQIDTPEAIYEQPDDRYVAEFVGEANFLDAVVRRVDDVGMRVSTSLGDLDVRVEPDESPTVGTEVVVMIRPEYCELRPLRDSKSPQPNTIQGVISSAVYAGSRSEYICEVRGEQVHIWALGMGRRLTVGTEVEVELRGEFIRMIHGSLGVGRQP
ncbi:MAG: ATP-binding cassette domain-containing protein [Acidimicrobiia bacterium]|nr:ATP-binding cassette domain-containing protein [Acidimicrobiia bacterium]